MLGRLPKVVGIDVVEMALWAKVQGDMIWLLMFPSLCQSWSQILFNIIVSIRYHYIYLLLLLFRLLFLPEPIK